MNSKVDHSIGKSMALLDGVPLVDASSRALGLKKSEADGRARLTTSTSGSVSHSASGSAVSTSGSVSHSADGSLGKPQISIKGDEIRYSIPRASPERTEMTSSRGDAEGFYDDVDSEVEDSE